MNSRIHRFLMLGLALFFTDLVLAQPCLSGWDYRVPVEINNTGAALTGFQVKVTVNTQSLVTNGKARLSGQDIRFLNANGVVLPFWIENDTYSTSDTKLWVKVDNIAANSTTTIYLFYGNSSALNLSNGNETFELFDDFNDITIDAAKWNTCGAGTISVSNGAATISSTATANQKSILESTSSFSTNVYVEADVVTVSNGQSFIGFHNGSDNGFAMNYEVNGQPSMLMREINSDGGGCFTLTDVQDPVNQDAKSANTVEGTWSFAWYTGNMQSFQWPGQTAVEVRNEDEHTIPANVNVVIGHKNQGDLNGIGTTAAGSIKLDWMRVRKYTANPPAVSIGAETEINAEVTASGPSQICQGENLSLKASSTPGATYSWSGPNGFASTDQNPTLNAIGTAGAGTYTVTATVPSNCQSMTASVTVSVDATTVAGSLSGGATVCQASNTGTISLTGNIGNVIRWEQSINGDLPWITINNTATSLTYTNLQETTYYRAVVKNGLCNVEFTGNVKITVDQLTIPGAVTEEREVCYAKNEGTVRLTDFEGSIVKWQKMAEGGAWTDVVSTDTTLTFKDLTITTSYRAEVKNGVCASGISKPVTIKVNPLPVPAFSADAVCLGVESAFKNTSSIPSGEIAFYNWDFTDGQSATGRTPAHEFVSSGDFEVKMIATSLAGCSDSVTQTITVYPLPEVSFLVDPVCQRVEATFQPNVSISNGSLTSYMWDFGDGNNQTTATSETIDYLYDTTGVYATKLVVTSDQGCKDSLSYDLHVYPRATLSFSAPSVFFGQTSAFENNSTITQGNLTYAWSFGDGQSSNRIQPTHVYATADTFNVQVISTSSFGGCTDTLKMDHIVHPQVVADFTFSNVCQDYSADFTNQSLVASGTLSYEWNFGDGTSSTNTDPIHHYEAPGTYLVTLVATSDLGSTDQKSKNIKIHPEPVANLDLAAVCDTDSASFKSLSSVGNGTLTFHWEFGDGSSSTNQDPKHLYTVDGTYDILHVVTTNEGCMDSISSKQIIHPLPQTNFSVDTVCFDVPTVFVNESTIAQGAIKSYQWNFGDQTNSIEVDPSKLYSKTGNYNVKLLAVSDRGCEFSVTNEAVVLPNPVVRFDVEDVCFGFTSEFINRSTVGIGQLTYRWDFGDTTNTSDLTDPTLIYSNPGIYDVQLYASSQFGCADSTTITTEVFALPTVEAGEDRTVSKGYKVMLDATGAENYFWTPADGLDFQGIASPEATPLQTTTYTVIGVDENGCEDKDQVTVNVDDDFLIKPANLLSPDGNKINDTWNIVNIETYPEATVRVFDLWGRKIYDSENYQQDWQGTNGTDLVPDGEYFYLITSPRHSRLYKGTITILKNR